MKTALLGMLVGALAVTFPKVALGVFLVALGLNVLGLIGFLALVARLQQDDIHD